MAKKKLVTEDEKYHYFVRANLCDGSPQIYRVEKTTKKTERMSYNDKNFVPAAMTYDDLQDRCIIEV